MAKRRRKTELEQERMTDANMLKVIGLLEPKQPGTPPITKKEACAILGMSYNTSRLADIIQDFKARQNREKERRAALRGKPATEQEISFIIKEYLEGGTVESISKSTYRGSEFIKNILDHYHVPRRAISYNYFTPQLIPDEATKDRFSVGETVYSTRYDTLAKVMSEKPHSEYGWVYNIWLSGEKWMQYAYQPACELASLKHLEQAGVKF
jgi:hypothetical protein